MVRIHSEISLIFFIFYLTILGQENSMQTQEKNSQRNLTQEKLARKKTAQVLTLN